MRPQIEIRNTIKEFIIGGKPLRIIKGINYQISKGDFIIIYGPSGCGKSTLLNIICGWEKPTSGKVLIDGEDIYSQSEDWRAKLRQTKVSMIHQNANWIKSLNVIDNITMPYLLAGKQKSEANSRAEKLLSVLNLEKYKYYKPMDLSGGQQQRISLIRALINNPSIIMADEPTGNLDTLSSKVVMELFHQINFQFGRTIIMVTHNNDLITYGNESIKIIDGQIVSRTKNSILKQNPSPRNDDIINIKIDNKFFFNSSKEEFERGLSKIK